MGLRRFEDRRCYFVRKGTTKVGTGAVNDATPLYLSATTRVTSTRSSTVSSHPLASGNDTTNHSTTNNETITVQGILSDSPSILGLFASENQSDMVAILKELKEIRVNKELVDVHFFELGEPAIDCLITNIVVDKTVKTGDGVSVTISFKAVLLAPTSIVVTSEAKADKLSAKTEGGNKPAREVTAEKGSVNSSLTGKVE